MPTAKELVEQLRNAREPLLVVSPAMLELFYEDPSTLQKIIKGVPKTRLMVFPAELLRGEYAIGAMDEADPEMQAEYQKWLAAAPGSEVLEHQKRCDEILKMQP